MNKLFVLTCCAMMVSLAACKTKKEEQVEIGKYNATSPLMVDTTFTKEYVAQVQSLQNIEIRAKVKGYIETINADEGQLVHAGQLLFTIRPREYEAELQKARANVKTAELDVMNVKLLAEKNIVSANELATAKAKLDEAKAEENLAELYVSYTRITAPFDGTIDRIRFKKGSLIDEGTLLTSLSNNKEVYAYFNVSEVEYLDYKSQKGNDRKNSATLILANNQPHKYKGAIETIESEFDNNTGNIAFRAKFPNPDLLLKHGETGKVQLTVPLKSAMIIPQKASFEVQDKIYVYVIGADQKVRSRNISIRQKLPNLYVVESGLAADEHILLDGIQSVKEEDKVETVFTQPAEVISRLQLIKQ